LVANAQTPPAEEIIRRSHLAEYYPGDDMKTRVLMRLVSKDGKERIRELTMLRKDLREGGEQRYFIYFHRPPDVREMTFMVWKYPQKNADRWLFIPALKLVRRIAADDKRSSFVGSDFSYEDVSGRNVEEDSHKLLREETLGGKDAYVIESVPKDPAGSDFGRKISWIDKRTLLPLKEEYFDKRGDLAKVFSADEVKEVQGLWTITRRTMRDAQTGHRTEATFQDVRYNLGLAETLFSERYLRNPPPEAVR
jgi:outer membrane lipoprotein-sorting protein